MRASGAFRGLDVGRSEDDTAERVVRRFFEACEASRRRGRTERLLRTMARSALGGTRRWRILNAFVSNPFSTLVGIDDRAQRVQLVSAHLLGIAYARYVFAVEPLASLPVDRVIELSVPVVQYYLTDPPAVRLGAAIGAPVGVALVGRGVDEGEHEVSTRVSTSSSLGRAVSPGGEGWLDRRV